jgi:hypothetical protein
VRCELARLKRLVVVMLAGGLLSAMPIACGGSEEQTSVDPLSAPKQCFITGKVLSKSGSPLGRAKVFFHAKGPGATGGGTDSGANGAFTWAGPQGTYEVVVMVNDKEVIRQTVEMNKDKVEGVELKAK